MRNANVARFPQILFELVQFPRSWTNVEKNDKWITVYQPATSMNLKECTKRGNIWLVRHGYIVSDKFCNIMSKDYIFTLYPCERIALTAHCNGLLFGKSHSSTSVRALYSLYGPGNKTFVNNQKQYSLFLWKVKILYILRFRKLG